VKRIELLVLAFTLASVFSSVNASPETSILLIVDRVYVTPSSSFNVTVLAPKVSRTHTLVVRLKNSDVALEETVLPAVEKVVVALRAPAQPGIYYVEVLLNASPSTVLAITSEPLPVVDPSSWGEPLLLVFVWHCHQGISVMPDGTFHGAWAFAYVHSGMFEPYYPGGPYALHAFLLEKHPRVKFTENLSPSLLWQWVYAAKFGYRTSSTYVSPNSTEVESAKELVSRFARLASEGRVELLTSFFDHPIPGYVAEKFEWGLEEVTDQLAWGIALTSSTFNVTPRGAWVPEMFFSMKLVKPMSVLGIEYTILDARYHLSTAKGEVGTPYEPYLLVSDEGAQLELLFRDSDLSDFVSFGVNPSSGEEAEVLARRFAALVLSRKLENPNARLVVVAADGENWLLGNKLKAVFFDKMLSYVEECQPLLLTVTASEALSSIPARRRLSWVPTTSWAGGDWVWTSRTENSQQWDMIAKAGECYTRIKRTCKDPALRLAAGFALALTLNSDVIHREYTMPQHTEAWYRQLEMICRLGAREAEKLLSNHLTPDFSSPRVLEDCVACQPTLWDYAPQLALAAAAAFIGALTLSMKRRRSRGMQVPRSRAGAMRSALSFCTYSRIWHDGVS
jgi:hypothetical protein